MNVIPRFLLWGKFTVAAVVVMTYFDQAAKSMLLFFPQTTPLFRIIAFFLVWVGCWLPLAIPTAMALNWHPPKPLAASQKLPLLASLYLLAPLLLWGVAWVEGASFSNYGLLWNPSVLVSLGLGLGLSVLSLTIVFGIEWALGWINWQQSNWKELGSIWLPILLLGLWIGGTEELIFRGFLVNELTRGEFNQLFHAANPNFWVAAAISSLIFALLHLVWEIRETLPQVPGLWLMGMILVLARACDGGSLGLAWGLHAGWIWGMASIDSAQLITYTGKGSAWFTGLAEKPLAGLAGIVCLLGTAAVLLILDFGF